MRPAHWLLLAQRPVPAQSSVGRWRVHPMPNIDAQRETPKRTADIETFRILETTFWGNHSLITQSQLLYQDFYLTGAQGESIKCWRRGKCRQRNTQLNRTGKNQPHNQIQVLLHPRQGSVSASDGKCIPAQSPAFHTICSLCVKDYDFVQVKSINKFLKGSINKRNCMVSLEGGRKIHLIPWFWFIRAR